MSKPARILLAEDNAADVWLIQEALKRQSLDYEIENYTNAEDAIRAILGCGFGGPVPDLILLDYNLPKGHGGEILAAAASNPHLANVPKAILSSFLQPRELELMLTLGVRCFITKPADLYEFLGVVGAKVNDLLKGSAPPEKAQPVAESA
jgi:chemotaxis family two-component system response regulator Rcp1